MGNAQKHPLRAVTPPEEQEMQRIVKATSERMDVVKRARALLCVQAGRLFTEAAREAGYKSGDSRIGAGTQVVDIACDMLSRGYFGSESITCAEYKEIF